MPATRSKEQSWVRDGGSSYRAPYLDNLRNANEPNLFTKAVHTSGRKNTKNNSRKLRVACFARRITTPSDANHSTIGMPSSDFPSSFALHPSRATTSQRPHSHETELRNTLVLRTGVFFDMPVCIRANRSQTTGERVTIMYRAPHAIARMGPG